MGVGVGELNELRQSILDMAFHAGEGHIPSSLSILEIIWSIYDGGFVTKGSESSFVLSKGHGCLALYAVLAKKNFFPPGWLNSFAKSDSVLGGHPDSTLVPEIVASTGSLGHGFPMAAGMAYAQRISGGAGRVFSLIGDGEANEGTIWETALIAANHHLANLVCIIDSNDSSTRAVDMGDIGKKFESFGWDVSQIDGHNSGQIKQALKKITRRPHAIVATTVKGHGIREMAGNPAWHHTRLTEHDWSRFRNELL